MPEGGHPGTRPNEQAFLQQVNVIEDCSGSPLLVEELYHSAYILPVVYSPFPTASAKYLSIWSCWHSEHLYIDIYGTVGPALR